MVSVIGLRKTVILAKIAALQNHAAHYLMGNFQNVRNICYNRHCKSTCVNVCLLAVLYLRQLPYSNITPVKILSKL